MFQVLAYLIVLHSTVALHCVWISESCCQERWYLLPPGLVLVFVEEKYDVCLM